MTTRLILLALIFASPVFAQVVVAPSDEWQQRASAVADNEAQASRTIKRSLQDILKHIDQPEWQQQQANWRHEIGRLTGSQLATDAKNDDLAVNKTRDRLVLFVSSSMPMPTLRAYAKDLSKADGLMVFRGMVGGLKTVTPTLKLMAEILRVNPGCDGPRCAMRATAVVIDPLLFREHGIAKVPALVFVEEMALAPYCDGIGERTSVQASRHVIYGDLSLNSLAQELQRMSGNTRLAQWLRSL